MYVYQEVQSVPDVILEEVIRNLRSVHNNAPSRWGGEIRIPSVRGFQWVSTVSAQSSRLILNTHARIQVLQYQIRAIVVVFCEVIPGKERPR